MTNQFTPQQLAAATRTIMWQRYSTSISESLRDIDLPAWDGLRDAALTAAHNANPRMLYHDDGWVARGNLEPEVDSQSDADQIMATILSDLDNSSPRRDDHWNALREKYGDATFDATVTFLRTTLGLIKIRDGLVYDNVPGRREMMSPSEPEPEPEPTNENVTITPELKPESVTTKPKSPAKRAVAKPVPQAPAPAPAPPSVQAMLATTNTTLHQLVQVLSVGVGRGLLGGVADTADAATYEISRRALAQRIAVLLAIRGSITRAELAADCVSHGQRGVLKDALDWAVVIGAFNVTRPTRGRYSLADASLLGLTAEALQELVEIQRTKDSDRQAKRANEGIAKYRDRVLAR